MLHPTTRQAALIVLSLAACTAKAADDKDGPAPTIEITTNLDLKVTVKVQATSNNARTPFLDPMTNVCVDSPPKLRLALDQGHATYLIVPLSLVKYVAAAADKGHRLTLADDSEHLGNILTTITDANGKTYDLASSRSVVNRAPAEMPKPDPKVQRHVLTLSKPASGTYQVLRPNIRTERLGANPLTMSVDGQTIQANLSDFDKVVLARGKTWQIGETPPGSAEKKGELVMRNGWWFLGCETPTGCILMLRGQNEDPRFPDNPGFSLEKVREVKK